MPAKTMLFDQRVRTLHDFGASPHNFNPQGRLIVLAGFGNLAGKIEIVDCRTLSKMCTIDAPNMSYCEWSLDGRFLLTATLSPWLRVDNGIKICGECTSFRACDPTCTRSECECYGSGSGAKTCSFETCWCISSARGERLSDPFHF